MVWLVLLMYLTAPARGQVILSEFQASNVGTLRDEDGDTSDWIEIANTGKLPVDLAGWYLTDDASHLKKWQFPATNLPPGRFLIVFASNKDRRVPGTPLHTNFKLATDGEYLALIKPDGVTPATAYSPAYPPQADAWSYGMPLNTRTVTLLEPGASGKVLVPSDGGLGTNWVLPEFNDAGWADVKMGVGFDVNNSIVTVALADSVSDWSVDGEQGKRGWYYGYYNKTGDQTPGYQTNDFVPFPRTQDPYGPNNYWTGTQYWSPSGTGCWDLLGQMDVYPNGTNDSAEHWVIRRWVSQTNGIVQARWRLYKKNPTGSGVTGLLYRNGVLQDSSAITGDDTTGIDRTIMLGEIREGDIIDLAVTPVGADGSADDAGDSAANSLTVLRLDAMTSLVATPVADLMRGSNATAYVRLPFLVADTEDLDQLTLRLLYNDGFVAYLNGQPVAARNAPQPVAGGTQADSVADWSYTGQQGLNNWYYGYYNQSGDADGVYNPATDFNSTDSQWGDRQVRASPKDMG